MSTAGGAALTVARRMADSRVLATTPARLRLISALLILAAIVFGVLAARAAGTRQDGVRSVEKAERLLVSAHEISTSLSDAHAIAANSFLLDAEPTGTRVRYVGRLKVAGLRVAQLAGEIGTSARGGTAVQSITSGLAVYPGLIDEARANNRQGLPAGSAYLREASSTLRDSMLPSTRDLYRIEAQKLGAGYAAGTSTWSALAVVLAGCALLALLAAAQVYLARATRRTVNLRLALATGVLLALISWVCVAFAQQQSALAQAQREGSDPLLLLTATRILAARAQTTDQSIALFALGNDVGALDPAIVARSFRAVIRPIGLSRPGPARGSGGLLDKAADIPGAPVAAIDGIYHAYRGYLDAHQRLVTQQSRGKFDEALKRAVGESGANVTSTKDASAALNRALDLEIVAARKRFERHSAQADAKLAGLEAGIPLLTALSALLALLGVRERLEEYR